MTGQAHSSALPVADSWYRSRVVTPRVTRIDEPYVNELLRANTWFVQGRDRDLVIDAGLGVVPFRAQLPRMFDHDPVLVITHAHLDHAGSAHEFQDRRAHPAELARGPLQASLFSEELSTMLGLDGLDLPELLIDALPWTGYDPSRFTVPPLEITTELDAGDTIDLGDQRFVVLHLPGHTPGSICLFDEQSGALFSGDVIYDDLLLDELHESNIDDYIASMRVLRELSPSSVYPGHGEPFGGDRMRCIIASYLTKRTRS